MMNFDNTFSFDYENTMEVVETEDVYKKQYKLKEKLTERYHKLEQNDIHYKWLNTFKTTTFHMFLCHTQIEYIKNERYPAVVYENEFYDTYGNAYEVLINGCKFYITTELLSKIKTDIESPRDIVTKIDYEQFTPLLQCVMADGATLLQHMCEAMFYTMVVGIPNEDVQCVLKRISMDKCEKIRTKYSWRSEMRKIRKKKEKNCDDVEDETLRKFHKLLKNSVEVSFDAFYKKGRIPNFIVDTTLNHAMYSVEFMLNVFSLKKRITTYVDCVSNLRLMIKDMIGTLYRCDADDFENVCDVVGDYTDVQKFIAKSKSYPKGDVIFSFKQKGDPRYDCRINCFKMDTVHVWVNGTVNKMKKPDIDLPRMLDFGTHHIVSFDHMHNSLLRKAHAETVRLVMRYIISRRCLDLLKNDIDKLPKLHYTKIEY
ncbi:immediate early protein 1 [Phthorimaea operculella granulovirus]|uniref:Immediate early protein 1 n=1 Tax=Phthorimaea operculella granulovirus TaxID=192584 RepID=Q8JS53_9BBAC|nr:immediate early protein 1 [Phthorimaea operculella granulovirus]AAM70204.1 immediate early protein 1 [Phthorimaea operculella granulovirus]ANY57395.1 immediate early protein 1 [Phthorimaea operculella granulovirus]QBH65841.1 immediate early protein 1 [Phthorimaea operculella granulovirus]QBH65971.1 immediate early protein 1 [Phthorimaea operculella granulovirus]QBH66101.1 immediate early protein 1 [Phthorimaea operculella granulovirus]